MDKALLRCLHNNMTTAFHLTSKCFGNEKKGGTRGSMYLHSQANQPQKNESTSGGKLIYRLKLSCSIRMLTNQHFNGDSGWRLPSSVSTLYQHDTMQWRKG